MAEAKSEAKRTYMAEAIFPELEPRAAQFVADLANLYYWWHLEPAMKPVVAERVRGLSEIGLSVEDIAASQNLPIAGVLQALANRDRG